MIYFNTSAGIKINMKNYRLSSVCTLYEIKVTINYKYLYFWQYVHFPKYTQTQDNN